MLDGVVCHQFHGSSYVGNIMSLSKPSCNSHASVNDFLKFDKVYNVPFPTLGNYHGI